MTFAAKYAYQLSYFTSSVTNDTKALLHEAAEKKKSAYQERILKRAVKVINWFAAFILLFRLQSLMYAQG